MPLSKSPDDRDLVNVLLAFDWFDERIFRGILRFANENKWHLSPYHFSDYSLPEGWPGDGAITCYGDNIKAQIEKLDMPWVDITAKPFEAICPRVYVDDDIIGRIAANHFVNRGFKRFGFFDWKLECVTVNQLRKDAYFDELRKKGFDEADFYLIEQSEGDILNNFELHRRHILAQLELLPRPIGIYTGQDNLAADLVEICGRNNIHVPEEVAILGTDNIELICKSSLVPISSIDANFGELGYRAAQRLQQLMDGEISNDADPVKIEPKGLVRRRSTDVLAVKHPKVAEAIREIKAHLHEPVTIEMICEKIGFSKNGLEKAFRTHLGRTPASELRRMRLDHAKYMLVETDEKIDTIAYQCGYSNSSNLGNAFTKDARMSPRDYRKKFRGTE